MSKTALIDVGGGFRGIYAAGVMDWCLDHDIYFDVGIGVSAGSANLASFIAGQKRRNYEFYTHYALRKEAAGLRSYVKTHSFLNLEYIYGTLSNSDGERPIDYPAMIHNPMEFVIVATDARTGEARYFDKNDLKLDQYQPIMASSCLPGVCRPYPIGDDLYFDGALSDPVPIMKAIGMGCDQIVLLLTKPVGVLRTPKRDRRIARQIEREFPKAAEKLVKRAECYNDGVSFAQKLQEKGCLLIVAPDDTCGVDTLTRDKAKLHRLYEKGYADGQKIGIFRGKSSWPD